MPRPCARALLVALLIPVAAATTRAQPPHTAAIVSGGTVGEHRALLQALAVLPGRPPRVAVIDAAEARADVRDELLRLDAFVVQGSAVVYVVKQSAVLRGAVAGSTIHLHALATVIWHEVAHAGGADERGARARERALWTSFIRDQRVDQVDALRYLSALERRPDAHLLARSSP